jgi:predicted KAP-like P-loop ATPase
VRVAWEREGKFLLHSHSVKVMNEERDAVLERIRVDVMRKDNALKMYKEQIKVLEEEYQQTMEMWKTHLRKWRDKTQKIRSYPDERKREKMKEIERLKKVANALEREVHEMSGWKLRALELKNKIDRLKGIESKESPNDCINCFLWGSSNPSGSPPTDFVHRALNQTLRSSL